MDTLWVALQQCGRYPFLKMEKKYKGNQSLSVYHGPHFITVFCYAVNK